jgi:hypothetical protein
LIKQNGQTTSGPGGRVGSGLFVGRGLYNVGRRALDDLGMRAGDEKHLAKSTDQPHVC